MFMHYKWVKIEIANRRFLATRPFSKSENLDFKVFSEIRFWSLWPVNRCFCPKYLIMWILPKTQINNINVRTSLANSTHCACACGMQIFSTNCLEILQRRRNSFGLVEMDFGWSVSNQTQGCWLLPDCSKIVQRPAPFLTRHSASRLGGVPPMNNLPHDHVSRKLSTTINLESQNRGWHESFTASALQCTMDKF